MYPRGVQNYVPIWRSELCIHVAFRTVLLWSMYKHTASWGLPERTATSLATNGARERVAL